MTTDLPHCFCCLADQSFDSVYLTVPLDDGDYIICFVCLQELQKLQIEAQEVKDVLSIDYVEALADWEANKDSILNEIF